MPDVIYKNAPLFEAIAEVRWQLQPLQVLPGAAVDPYFDKTSAAFRRKVAEAGFTHSERLTPSEAPLELFAHKPVWRFRQQADVWPLFQLGPGILTANVVPPYGGWKTFREFIRLGVQFLSESHPLWSDDFETSALQLRYLDGFRPAHGMNDYTDFAQTGLNLSLQYPEWMLADAVPDPAPEAVVQYRVLLNSPAGGLGRVALKPGKVHNESAAILDMSIQSRDLGGMPVLARGLSEWFDQAHGVLKSWFGNVMSDPVASLVRSEPSVGRETHELSTAPVPAVTYHGAIFNNSPHVEAMSDVSVALTDQQLERKQATWPQLPSISDEYNVNASRIFEHDESPSSASAVTESTWKFPQIRAPQLAMPLAAVPVGTSHPLHSFVDTDESSSLAFEVDEMTPDMVAAGVYSSRVLAHATADAIVESLASVSADTYELEPGAWIVECTFPERDKRVSAVFRDSYAHLVAILDSHIVDEVYRGDQFDLSVVQERAKQLASMNCVATA